MVCLTAFWQQLEANFFVFWVSLKNTSFYWGVVIWVQKYLSSTNCTSVFFKKIRSCCFPKVGVSWPWENNNGKRKEVIILKIFLAAMAILLALAVPAAAQGWPPDGNEVVLFGDGLGGEVVDVTYIDTGTTCATYCPPGTYLSWGGCLGASSFREPARPPGRFGTSPW